MLAVELGRALGGGRVGAGAGLGDGERGELLREPRSELLVQCQITRREEAVRRYLDRLLPDYKVYIDGERVRELSPTERVAPRAEMSRED